jgi:hypothetical protein
MQNEWFHIQQWRKDEQNRNVRSDDDFSDSDRFTIHNDVPIVIEDNDPHNGE